MGFLSSLAKIVGVAAAPVTGGASLGLTALSTAADIGSSLYAANEASSAADANRLYQTNMSNTSYQRAVADMRAAGLNPALAYSQGGASTPSGNVADTSALSSMKAGSTALNSLMAQTQVANTAQATRTAAAQQALNAAQAEKVSLENAAWKTMSPLARQSVLLGGGASGAAAATAYDVKAKADAGRSYGQQFNDFLRSKGLTHQR